MILGVTSSLESFKSLQFGTGLNILLAEIAAGSTEKHTRNSVGKTSLVEIVHFLLGSDAPNNSLFKHPKLINHSFSLDLWIKERRVRVTRSGNKEKCIFVSDEDAEAVGLVLSREDEAKSDGFVSVDDWKVFLGVQWFDLPLKEYGTPFSERYAPTFRQLIGYFARRRKSDGYTSIEKQNGNQQPGDWQVALSYLLGLDWEVAREFQEMRTRKKSASALKKAIKEGELGQLFGTTAEIRPELARTEEKLGVLRAQVDHFQVHENYREMGTKAAKLKDLLSEIAISLTETEVAAAYLQRSVEEEKAPAYADVDRLYRSAGIELPGVALRRFGDVKAFQASVTTNRRHYLEQQITEIHERRRVLSANLTVTGEERAEILQSLEGKGAFDDLSRLREDLGKLSSRAETLRSKLQHAAAFENNIAQLKREAADLTLKLQSDHEKSEELIKKATVLVDRAIAQLYDDRTGNLIIEAKSSGPVFRIDIDGGGNLGGIDMMKIFCFDMMLLQMANYRFATGPGFIMHDSHIFDGVDERQVGKALGYGDLVSREIQGQYIVTMNSDEFAKIGQDAKSALEASVLDVRLTDDETGGLFGFRFN